MGEMDGVRVVDVAATFRHSSGELGTRFFTAIKDDCRLLGWRTGTPARVVVPPKDIGLPGEWLEIGPEGTLEAYAPADWMADLGLSADDGGCLALVTPDGADTAILARLRPAAEAGALPAGQRVVVRFAEDRTGSMADFWFEAI